MLKKLSIIITTGLLLFTVVTPVTADDSYVPSITAKDTVEISGGTGDSKATNVETKKTANNTELSYKAGDGCEVEIILTPYSKKSTIASPYENKDSKDRATESISEIDIAWSQVYAADKVVDYAPVMKKEVKKLGIDEDDLVTKDLFDVTVYVNENGTHTQEYNHYRIYNLKLTTEALKNFVALLHYNAKDNKWELVSNARVTGDAKDTLTFSYGSASPFAIIVKKADGQGTGGNTGTTDKDSSVPNTAVRVVDTIRNASVTSYFLWILLVILAIVVTYTLNKHKRHEKKR